MALDIVEGNRVEAVLRPHDTVDISTGACCSEDLLLPRVAMLCLGIPMLLLMVNEQDYYGFVMVDHSFEGKNDADGRIWLS